MNCNCFFPLLTPPHPQVEDIVQGAAGGPGGPGDLLVNLSRCHIHTHLSRIDSSCASTCCMYVDFLQLSRIIANDFFPHLVLFTDPDLCFFYEAFKNGFIILSHCAPTTKKGAAGSNFQITAPRKRGSCVSFLPPSGQQAGIPSTTTEERYRRGRVASRHAPRARESNL